MFRSLLTLALALPLLVACQLSPIGGSRDVTASVNPITGGEIAVTTLDAPASPAASSPAPSAVTSAAATGSAPPQRPATAPPAVPAAEPTIAPTTAPAPVVPQASKSASQIACEEDGGNWARAGESVAMTCIRPTRDGGQRCDSKSDCDGECLARSRTCSPIKPLFGCNPVLMDTGAEVTLCIE
jgi:hypothetical protein